MNAFSFYFPMGWEHIISVDALDHQLFIIALAALYTWSDWRKVLVLVTAFTIGHSVTLLLSVLDWIRLDSKWVEFLIPLTIMITAALNLFQHNQKQTTSISTYGLALFFGFIHGMGFANSIRFMLAQDQQIGWGLFGFNVGLELGQMLVVVLLLCINHFVTFIAKLPAHKWNFIVSSLVLGIAFGITMNRYPF
ncbi:MAG: HupE/UreJ family protein [Chitinophagaceae bacterium]|nr:HupE/UreJ family protein [Chitinophagia bacterium]NDB52586.1 HupE/UreJ family protein [Chitinophagaceae bacterium]